MVSTSNSRQAWQETVGGFRGSVFLVVGAALLAVAGVINVLGEIQRVQDPDPFHPVVVTAWLLHIGALWTLGAGFCWTAAHPFLGRAGFLPGVLHIGQGVYLLLILFTTVNGAHLPVAMSAGRLLAVAIFAVLESRALGRACATVLLVTSGLQLGKVLLRAFGGLPYWGVPWDAGLDAVLLLVVAAGMHHLGTTVRRVEDDWVQANHRPRTDDFAQFNNPEHAWNKGDRKGR